MSAADRTDKTKPYIPLAGGADDGWSNDEEATATCFCGAVQLKFPTLGPGYTGSFVCNCSDCHKITASMFASNFTVLEKALTHVRGRDNLSTYAQSHTIASGHVMTNYFCKTCGTLMYRKGKGFPDQSIMRIGTVDDFHLHDTKLKPTVEYFVEQRAEWLRPIEGLNQVQGMGN
ncbi:Mss4-like protein, partial [Mycena vitilis]